MVLGLIRKASSTMGQLASSASPRERSRNGSLAEKAVGSPEHRRANGRPRVLMPGGYGVFGRHLARELLRSTAAHLVIAGRDGAKAALACEQLGSPDRVEPLSLDLRDLDAVDHAANRRVAVAGTA